MENDCPEELPLELLKLALDDITDNAFDFSKPFPKSV
jgi:hypothetical protein